MDMKWLHLFQANLRKEFIELKRYLPNTIAMLVTFYLIFLGMFAGIQVIGDPGSQDLHTQYAIVNYVFWFLAFMVVNNIGYEVINEGMRGTLEQLSMSPLGIWRIVTARLIASTLLNFITVSCLPYAATLTTNRSLTVDFLTIVSILMLTFASMCCRGLMMRSISIIVKQVPAFLQILRFILAGLPFVSLGKVPWLAYFPFVKGVDLVRRAMIDGVSIGQMGMGDISLLGLNAIIYFSLGLAFFLYCERYAIRKGLLSHY